MSKNNTFITGANGFLGRNMLELLLRNTDDNFYLLIRSEASRNSIMERFKWAIPERINFVHGDLKMPFFGMDDRDVNKVVSCKNYWHFAAATSFDDRKQKSIVETNICGTKNIIKLALESKDLKHLHFVSTAYIAGNNKGVIYEDKMPQKVGFKNSYEESKYDSEIILKETNLPWTIYRPSIVVGNSKTLSSQGEMRMIYGYVLGVYNALLHHFKSEEKFVSNWENQTFSEVNLRMKGYYKTKKNFICIDDVVGMINDIMQTDCINKIYNLTSDSINGEDICYAFNKGFRVKGIKYVGKEIDSPSRVELKAHRLTSAFDDYCLNDDPAWSTNNTDKSLSKHKKVGMNKDLFCNLIEHFIKNEIINPYLSKNGIKVL